MQHIVKKIKLYAWWAFWAKCICTTMQWHAANNTTYLFIRLKRINNKWRNNYPNRHMVWKTLRYLSKLRGVTYASDVIAHLLPVVVADVENCEHWAVFAHDRHVLARVLQLVPREVEVSQLVHVLKRKFSQRPTSKLVNSKTPVHENVLKKNAPWSLQELR